MNDKIICVPFGYNPSNKIPEMVPDVETDEEDNFTPEQEMLLDRMLSGIR